MASKQCIKWMKETKYESHYIYDCWLLPLNKLNKNTRYEDTVVGNSPDFMALDNSLNRDIQNSHDVHCILTSHLSFDNIHRFLRATPNLIDRGISQIWDDESGCPDVCISWLT